MFVCAVHTSDKSIVIRVSKEHQRAARNTTLDFNFGYHDTVYLKSYKKVVRLWHWFAVENALKLLLTTWAFFFLGKVSRLLPQRSHSILLVWKLKIQATEMSQLLLDCFSHDKPWARSASHLIWLPMYVCIYVQCFYNWWVRLDIGSHAQTIHDFHPTHHNAMQGEGLLVCFWSSFQTVTRVF